MDRFTRAGILRERVTLLSRLPREEYFRSLQSLDIALDPFPYNGGVSTCDAYWMGIPVITMPGGQYVSRQGVMINTHLGMTQWIVNTPQELLAFAKQINADRPALAVLRSQLRTRLLSSALCNFPEYLAEWESVLRNAWTQTLNTQQVTL
jgi:predicted O-linked N-acetylglucosamine transferase (SPINDLY family)